MCPFRDILQSAKLSHSSAARSKHHILSHYGEYLPALLNSCYPHNNESEKVSAYPLTPSEGSKPAKHICQLSSYSLMFPNWAKDSSSS
jgi:hypothetical protein